MAAPRQHSRRTPLAPTRFAAAPFPQGPFRALLTPSKQAIREGSYGTGHILTFLAVMPDADGERWVEVGHSAAVRQPVCLTPYRSGLLMVDEAVEAATADLEGVTGIALLNATGGLLAYGTFAGGAYGSTEVERVEFPVGNITIKPI